MIRKYIIPVLLGLLLVLSASTLVQAFSAYFYIIPASTSLRECPMGDCPVLLTAYRGDKVEILERNAAWSKVRLLNRPTGIGWVPNNLISYSPDLRSGPPPHYYVNTETLQVHQHPRPSATVVTTLHFNDPVEMLGVGKSGWAQVRDPKTSVVGWAPPRYLSDSPVAYHQPRRRRAPRKQAPAKKAPEAM
jgi:uncharacterized protein YgiM (DUF1202 family)